MQTPSSEKTDASARKLNITVPRDPDVDVAASERPTPAPGSVNLRDEDLAAANKPLPEDSPLTQALNGHQPHAPGQLGVGTAGDPARPTKEGIHDKPIPPRGHI
ncbi:MAG TPA: hypothetical protein VFB27_01100 [Opitutaceae bacterium]|nr:hypothetical protein [Opitutaceae bacterium]